MAKRTSRLSSKSPRRAAVLVTVAVLMAWLIAGLAGAAHAVPFAPGDVFVGIGFGQINHFASDGTFLETLDTTTGSFVDTGMCFDTAGNLYSTNLGANSVSKFDTNGLLLEAEYLTGFDAHPESCRFDAAGNLYIGQADGTHNLLKFDPAGNLVATFTPAIENRGTDRIDLAGDQCTMYYTSFGASVKRFDVCTNTQLPDFCGPCGPDQPPFRTFGLASPRLLSDGSLLVVDQETQEVRRFDSSAVQIQSYPVPIPDTYLVPPPGDGTPAAPFALALDPDGTSFWTADVDSGWVFKFDIASGALLTLFDGGILLDLEGLAVFGEPTAATGDQRVTVTASITATNKPYDTTTAATITSCTLSGVVGMDDVSCIASGGAFATASAGNGKVVTATVSLTGSAAGHYVLSSTTATTTANITPAPASVTPNAAGKTHGAADPAFTGTLTGFFAADGITATYSRTAGETVAGSPYTISATLSPAGALGNYAVTYNTASFTITKATASVSPNAASKTYGTADPAFTGTLTGFLAVDNVTATYSRTAGETVTGSPYTISATLSPASVLSNYAITYNTASFTIAKATPVVTWANPADITNPTPLGGTQLNATANVPGTFAYTPPAGTVLNPGNNQLLSVLFTPTDTSNYTTASAQVHISVLQGAAPPACPEDPNAVLTRAVDDMGAAHGSVPVYTTVQAAYNAAQNGDVIGMFSQTSENVTLGGAKTLTITQCTVAKITAQNSAQPVWNLTSTGALTIVGPDAVGGTIGWRIATSNHTVKSVRSTGASQYGIQVLGNNNSVSVNSVSGSPVGIRITGNTNDLRPGGSVSGNSGNGVEVGSTATGNTVRIGNIQSNGGHGILVDGSGNTVTSNGRVDSNGLNGILVNGSNNTIKSNAAGSDKAKGNGQAGIKVVGGTNTLDSNTANANGAVGVDVVGAGNKLKNNQSNQTSQGGNKENTGCEYRFADNTTQDQGSNKKDTASFAGALSGPRYAAGCYE